MPPYRSPESGSEFLAEINRIDNRVFMGERDNLQVTHEQLAITDRVLEEYLDVQKQDPDEVDSAVIVVTPHNVIYLGGGSPSLKAPLTERARLRTQEVLQSLSPDHRVLLSPSAQIFPREG